MLFWADEGIAGGAHCSGFSACRRWGVCSIRLRSARAAGAAHTAEPSSAFRFSCRSFFNSAGLAGLVRPCICWPGHRKRRARSDPSPSVRPEAGDLALIARLQ